MRKLSRNSKDGIIGFAIGDALGVPVEFINRKELLKSPVTQMLEYGSHKVPKGCWSDDTSMTLATMESIINNKIINTNDIADKFLNWFRNAEYTATGEVFDIGRTTIQGLAKYELKLNKASECGENDEYSNGNGSLMRMLPIAYYCFSKDLKEDEILKIVNDVSSITHKHEVSVLGCYIYVLFAIELLKGKSLKEAYETIRKLSYTKFSSNIKDKYKRILNKDISKYKLDEIKSTGYVVDTLEAVIWVLLNTKNYNQAVIGAVNLGDDTDTVGACVGGLAGILYGIEEINIDWKIDLIKYNYIKELCEKFDNIMQRLFYEHNNILPDYFDRKKVIGKIKILKGDITDCKVDCVVNAANESLLGGGGVDGAIHLKAGNELLEKCKELNGCKSGESKITKGYKMNSKYIIHTVAPKWYDNSVKNKEKILENCYKNSLELATDFNIKTIAFPCIGMGVYACPLEIGCKVAIDTVLEIMQKLKIDEQYEFDEIVLVCYGDDEFNVYKKYIDSLT
ncbi:MAG: ADP-ribosylglycohydrolase family protein [Clostridia bacterium]|nr:ADP-ribosylglycohydrolase family protein [Clostridia bacterium]